MALSLFSGSAGGNQQQQSLGHMDADEGGSRAPGLEVQLAGIMEQLLTDRVGAKDAIGLLEGVYNAAAERLRAESPQQLHRPARFMRIKALAQEMQCQAATWHLVWCLYCNPGSPAGIGGPSVPDAGDQRTYRQQLADKACMDPLLARVANVVAWLESLAADELAQQGVPRFADHDGVWIETRQAAGAGSLSELDPDAPGRQGKGLQADNAKAEERLMARLWQLVRAGRIKDARALCRQCGQPWRAASLGGAGPHGPLPVGIAATRQDDDATPDQQAEDLAVETASGAGTLRALWKWACLQVSEQAGRGLVGAAGRYEAALYGALSGNVSAVLPACGTWEDACWAYCRAWLDLSTDQALGVTRQAPHELVGGEVLMGMLQRCGLAGAGAAAGSGPAALDGALSVVLGGQWPSPALLAQQHGGLGGGRGAAELPRSFDAVFEALACSAEPAISTASREPLHMVQKLLVQDRLAGLTAHLHRWLVARGELPDPAEDAGAGQDASGPAAADDGVEGVAGLPARHPRMVAFAAHMLLLLEGLGDAAASVDGGLDHASGMREQVAVLYVAQLLEAGRPDTVSLVPQYLPLLRPPNRELLSQEMLSLLTQQLMAAAESATSAAGLAGSGAWAEADTLCARVYCSMAAWFQACLIRQEAQDGEEQVAREAAAMGVMAMAPDEPATSNALRTTVRPDEARILLNTFLESCRLSPAHGPLHRARAARWLAYPLLHPTAASGFSAAAATTDGAIAELAEPAAFCDALHLACALCSELALGDGVTATAAHHLLSEVLPADVESWAGQVAEQLREQATAVTADGGEGGAQGMDEDAEEDTAAAEASRATASELEALASELAQWRVYLELDHAMRGWEGRYGRYKAGEGGEGREALAEGARELLDGMLGRLLQAGWMGGLAAHERAAWADVSSAEGDGGGRIEVELALTCVGGAGQGLEGEGAGVGGWGVAGDAPFPSLKGATLFEAESRIRSALQLELQAQSQALGGGGPEQQQRQLQQQLDVQVLSPEGADGFVRVLMACQPSVEAWGRMLGLAVALLQGSLDGLPAGLLLVNLRAGRATSAAICRRCCLGQVVLHCSLVRQALVELGGDGSDGEALVELLADPNDAGAASFAVGVSGTGAGGEGLRLLEVLSAPMLRRVLQAEADTVVALMQQQQQRRQQQQQQQQRR